MMGSTSNNATQVGHPNIPHPSLEYPPFYFLLKSFPSLSKIADKLYLWRFTASYPLQKYIPGNFVLITWGELLLLSPLIILFAFGLATSFMNPSVTESGIVARAPLILCFLTSNHNSLLTFFAGIPFERAIKYHKMFGYIAFINGVFHTMAVINEEKEFLPFEGQANISGSCLLMVIFFMIATAMPVVRRRLFEVFFYAHILFAMAMMVCAFYHSGMLVVLLAFGTWGIDLFFRKIIMAFMRYPHNATIRPLTNNGSVIEMNLPKTKGFDYNPGQYFFISIPEISLFQWHPFSVSSSPYQDFVTFHINNCGDWTGHLAKLAKKQTEVSVLLEGPYGSLSVDLASKRRYKVAMLVGGGIGVTPMQSICQQLMHEHESGKRDLKHLHFLWTSRDVELMENLDITKVGNGLYDVTLHSNDDDYEESGVEESLPRGDEESLHNDTSSIVSLGLLSAKSVFDMLSASQMNLNNTGKNVLKLDFYVSSKKEHDECAVTDVRPFMTKGRPNMYKIFLDLKTEAIKQGERRVAVCACGPHVITEICRKACQLYSDDAVRFDFHFEVFD